MRISTKLDKLAVKLPFLVTATIISGFSLQSFILSTINPETATALAIHSITPNIGPTSGGQTVTITGDFNLPDAPPVITQISAGRQHSLVLDSNGQLWTWGGNEHSQLGNGTTSWCDNYDCYNFYSSIPVPVDMSGVLAGRTIVQIAAGFVHSLALDSEGNIYAWGANQSGQLGDGTGGHWSSLSNTPVAIDTTGVLSGRAITQIAAGWANSFAIDSTGQVFAWGNNSYGQLGNGTSGHWSSTVPVTVTTSGLLAEHIPTQISSSWTNSFVLDSNGNIFAWGGGILGNNTGSPWGGGGSNIPVSVDTSGALAGRTVVQIAAGGGHSLALDSTGSIFAWGANQTGQLGDGTGGSGSTFDLSIVPVAVNMPGTLAGRTIIQIAAGGDHSLALDSTGQVFAWGWGDIGMLGDGNSPWWCNNYNTWHTHQSLVPTPVLFPDISHSITSITLGNLPCTNIQIINSSTITCVTPAHPAGTVDVTVNTTAGSVTLYQSYTYIDDSPAPYIRAPGIPNTGHSREL